MARSFNGSTSRVETPGFGQSSPMRYTQFDLFIWVKFATGTTNAIIYNESFGTTYMQISANDGTAGRIRCYLQTGAPNFQLAHNGGYADGNWHLIRVQRVGLQEHHLYIDDMTTPKASNTTTLLTQMATGQSGTRIFGFRAGGGGNNPLNGEIADYWCYEGNPVTSGDLTAFVNRTKHPGQVSPTSLISWVSHGTTGPGIDAVQLPNQTFTGSQVDTTLVNGPHGQTGPIGLTTATDLANAWIYDITGTTLATADATRTFREPGNVIDRGTTPNRYCLYVTEMSNNHIAIYTSDDLATWTRYGLVDNTRVAEDPWVIFDGGQYHLWAENKDGGTNANDLIYYTSSDGLTWTMDTFSVTVSGMPAANDATSPIVWKEGSTYYMIYEPIPAATTRIATASSVNGTWTDQGELLPRVSGTYRDVQTVPDDIVKVGSDYYLIIHGQSPAGGISGTEAPFTTAGLLFNGVYTASSPTGSWTAHRSFRNPISGNVILGSLYGDSAQTFSTAGRRDLMYAVNQVDKTKLQLIQLWGDASPVTSNGSYYRYLLGH